MAGERTASRAIIFQRALPDRVDVIPDQLALRAGIATSLPITIQLQRAVGTTSPGVRVTFGSIGTTPDDTTRAAFLPASAVSDVAGVVRTRLTVLDTAYRGALRVRATVTRTGLSGDAVIQVLAP
jgi:hypothetical protein